MIVKSVLLQMYVLAFFFASSDSLQGIRHTVAPPETAAISRSYSINKNMLESTQKLYSSRRPGLRGGATEMLEVSEMQSPPTWRKKQGLELECVKKVAGKSDPSANDKKMINFVDLNKYYDKYEHVPSLNADYHGPHTHPGSEKQLSNRFAGKAKGAGDTDEAGLKPNQKYGNAQRLRTLMTLTEKQDLKVSASQMDNEEAEETEMLDMDYHRDPKSRRPVHN